jgi:hypothetical protein
MLRYLEYWHNDVFVGVWDFMTGKLKYQLANAALGAIVTHALVNKDGNFIVAAESGDNLLYIKL